MPVSQWTRSTGSRRHNVTESWFIKFIYQLFPNLNPLEGILYNGYRGYFSLPPGYMSVRQPTDVLSCIHSFIHLFAQNDMYK